MCLSVADFALFTVLLTRSPLNQRPRLILLAIALTGLPVLGVGMMFERTLIGTGSLTIETALAALYVGVCATVVAYLCWWRGVQILGASIAGQFIHLTPVGAMALAVSLMGERLGPSQVVGSVAIAAGLLVAQTSPRLARRPA